jgi:hypothetical protein
MIRTFGDLVLGLIVALAGVVLVGGKEFRR